MNDRPEVPCRLAKPSGSTVWHLVFRCPWCRRKHWHGAGPDPTRPAYGHRVSHCTAPGAPTGYWLVPQAKEHAP